MHESQTALRPSQLPLPVNAPVTAIVPACDRVDSLLRTLRAITACRPAPSEILVHLDGANPAVESALAPFLPQVRLLKSVPHVGPGGSRQKLILAAQHDLVANFDDDSFPVHPDYFSRIVAEATQFPNWAVISAQTLHDEAAPPLNAEPPSYRRMGVFSGCGCVFRQSWFQRIAGYVPLPMAYFMEEADVSLQLHAAGGTLWESPHLWVYHHAPDLQDSSASAMANSLANIALLGYLRYPKWLWSLIPFQVTSRLFWMARRGWHHGIWRGLTMIPRHLATYRSYRRPVPGAAILSWLRLRHRHTPIRQSEPLP